MKKNKIIQLGLNGISSSTTIKTRRAMKYHEQTLQIQCVQWFDSQYPKLTQLLFHIPNQGVRAAAKKGKNGKWYSPEGQRLKLMGLRAGVCDLFLTIPRGEYHGFYLEAKYGTGKLTPEQIKFRNSVEKLGYKWVEFRTIEKFMLEIKSYLRSGAAVSVSGS
jgi:hypothetical protein